MLRIGFAEADITPPEGIEMSGHWNIRISKGVRDPLFAHAMVIDDGKAPICLITCDVLSLRRSTVMSAREAIADATGLQPRRIGISATHTHYGPMTAKLWTDDQQPDPDYLAQLQKGIVRAAVEAFEARTPGRIGIGWTFEGKLSFNRRFMMRNGEVLMHPPVASTDILYQEGRTDPEVGVIAARDDDGNPLGYWVNFACHATVAGTADLISADYPGALAAEVKRRRGEGVVTLFGNGCCGNLCQIDVFDPDRPRNGDELLRIMGEGLADNIERAEAEMSFTDDLALDARSEDIALPLRRIPPELIEEAERVLAEAPAEPDPQQHRDIKYAEMWLELREQTRTSPMIPGEIQVFRIGDVGVVLLPGEIFVEHGLEIKLRSPAERTFVVELANGIMGYVPTREAFEGGGYEQKTGNNSKLSPVAGEFMVDTSLTLLDSMFR
ncbi:MAG: neutral/alkaline non-lysosomal ceramidase N-terminal domain-containing protein [Armatimonadetes bacterium]|nr:neutral/alkaline non-lysosomal ceramidase N-terminal domain-containing protein [Armatimonadota bacterium]